MKGWTSYSRAFLVGGVAGIVVSVTFISLLQYGGTGTLASEKDFSPGSRPPHSSPGLAHDSEVDVQLRLRLDSCRTRLAMLLAENPSSKGISGVGPSWTRTDLSDAMQESKGVCPTAWFRDEVVCQAGVCVLVALSNDPGTASALQTCEPWSSRFGDGGAMVARPSGCTQNEWIHVFSPSAEFGGPNVQGDALVAHLTVVADAWSCAP
jgi:hypothetical protein